MDTKWRHKYTMTDGMVARDPGFLRFGTFLLEMNFMSPGPETRKQTTETISGVSPPYGCSEHHVPVNLDALYIRYVTYGFLNLVLFTISQIMLHNYIPAPDTSSTITPA